MPKHSRKIHIIPPTNLIIFSDFNTSNASLRCSADELINIYKGKGTQKEKERIFDLLMSINASQNSAWENIKL